jgi:hypothetical protein
LGYGCHLIVWLWFFELAYGHQLALLRTVAKKADALDRDALGGNAQGVLI